MQQIPTLIQITRGTHRNALPKLRKCKTKQINLNTVYLNFLEVDECVKKPQVCHSNAKCMYNNGSYVCQCTDGYTGDGKNNCTGILQLLIK
jgi:hypothetical protein